MRKKKKTTKETVFLELDPNQFSDEKYVEVKADYNRLKDYNVTEIKNGFGYSVVHKSVTKPKPGQMKLHNNYRYIAIDNGYVVYDSSVDFLHGFKTLKACKLDSQRWLDDPNNQNIRIKYYKGRKAVK